MSDSTFRLTVVAAGFVQSLAIYLVFALSDASARARKDGKRTDDVLGWVLAGCLPYVLVGVVISFVVSEIALKLSIGHW